MKALAKSAVACACLFALTNSGCAGKRPERIPSEKAVAEAASAPIDSPAGPAGTRPEEGRKPPTAPGAAIAREAARLEPEPEPKADFGELSRAADPLAHLTDPGEGWTSFKPSAEARIIYVSSSEGDDANDGLSAAKPLKTIARGFAKLRNGQSDWLLLKRGDVWYEPIGSMSSSTVKSGRSEKEPTLIASYGTEGARPLLKVGDHGFGLRVAINRPGKARNIAVVGIHFYDQKGDPHSEEFVKDREKRGAGISWASPGENLLVEDCRFEWMSGGAIQGRSPWKGQPDDVLRNVKIRRCVAAYAWSSKGHCQGFFFGKVDGLLLEENVLDHNGWCLETGDLPTWFNHNVYITISCDKVVARGNIVARGSTTGIYCRTNGILEDNLCLDNSPSLNLGRIKPPRPGGVTGRIAGNVVIGALERKNLKRSIGGGPAIELGNVNRKGVAVENNIVIGTGRERSAAFVLAPLGVGVHNVAVRNNTVYNWTRCLSWVGVPGEKLEKPNLSGIAVEDNLFQVQHAAQADQPIIRTRDTDADGCGFAMRSNVYFFAPDNKECVQVKGNRRITLAKWLQLAGEEGSRIREVEFADPGRDAARYHGTLGREATVESFLAEARRQSKFNWRPEYTAGAVIRYVREGFRPKTDLGERQVR